MIKRNIVAVLVAALGITAGAAAFANAQTDDGPDTTATTATTSKARPEDGPRKQRVGPMGALGRAVHGDLIVRNRDGGFESVTLDRGTLESVGANEITLARPDGKKVTVKLDDGTRYKGVESKDQLRTGEGTLVVSKDGVAKLVGQRPEGAPERPKRPGRPHPARPEAS